MDVVADEILPAIVLDRVKSVTKTAWLMLDRIVLRVLEEVYKNTPAGGMSCAATRFVKVAHDSRRQCIFADLM